MDSPPICLQGLSLSISRTLPAHFSHMQEIPDAPPGDGIDSNDTQADDAPVSAKDLDVSSFFLSPQKTEPQLVLNAVVSTIQEMANP